MLEQALNFNESIYPDVNYYILRGKSNTLIKSDIFSTGDAFEYWEEFREDKMYKKITGEITIENNSIELDVNSMIFLLKYFQVEYMETLKYMTFPIIPLYSGTRNL